MEAEQDNGSALVDLLDRVLEKGLVLKADLLITVAGVPLLGLNLQAALGGLNTMLKYGMWNDWDAAQRAYALEEAKRQQHLSPALGVDETTLFSGFVSYRQNCEDDHTWRTSLLLLTDQRCIVYRRLPYAVFLDVLWSDVPSWQVRDTLSPLGSTARAIVLATPTGEAEVLTRSADNICHIIRERGAHEAGAGVEND